MEKTKKIIYFIGIGGISMSGLALMSLGEGKAVAGSDRKKSETTEKLVRAGIDVRIGQTAENIDRIVSEYGKDGVLVVYTSAVSKDNPELAAAIAAGVRCETRAEFLGKLMLGYENRIGIAGTHGKSTTTAMTDLIFEAAGKRPTLLNGAVMKEYGEAYKTGGRDWFIFEACEYRDSFLSFHPTAAVVTNVDFDHADYFKSREMYRESFGKYISAAELAVVNADAPGCQAVCRGRNGRTVYCSLNDKEADYYAGDIENNKGFYGFTLISRGKELCRIGLNVLGRHNVSNALLSAAAAIENGVEPGAVKRGLESFKGIGRRMEFVREVRGALVFDDYAHHPEEIKASLRAAKETGRRIICIFQPHSFSRAAEFFEEFKKAFADADVLILADIYENLEKDSAGAEVSSALLAEGIPGAVYLDSFEKIAARAAAEARPGDMIITMGAGDIYKVEKLF